MKKRLGFIQRSRSSESGQVIVLMALLLVGLIGAAALVVDGGRAYSERRSVQNAADNAALAGALALCQSSDVTAAGRASAAQNGFDNSASGVTVVVNQPPLSGPNSGNAEYVEVVISGQWQPGFLQVLSGDSGPITSAARAVARCIPSAGGPVGWGNGVIALNPSNDNVVYGPSSGCLQVIGGGVFVDSSNASAMYLDGGDGSGCPGGARIVADWVQLVGGVNLPSWVIPYGNPSLWIKPWPPQTGQAPRGDPMATLATPAIPAQPANALAPTISGSCTTSLYSGGNLNIPTGMSWCSTGVTIYPGTYRSMNISSDVPVTFQPGLYYVTHGDFTLAGPSTNRPSGSGVSIYVAAGNVSITSSSQVNLSSGSSGVLFHVESGNFTVGGSSSTRTLAGLIYVRSGPITIDGSSALTTTAPTSGPYAGLGFFMGRANANDLTVTGAGVLSMTGTIYAPNGRIASTGSGSNKTVNGQMIANRFYVTGGGRLVINYDDDVVFSGGSGGSSMIEFSE
ncbi:MAG: hypothetical protein KIT46_06945 [Anaerolineales bacterium]|nr:hypothetical protein [Anaerolineales bacterium]MCW5855765.1 hypothetical protein [Anaerolineales bacterium]